MNCIEVAKEYVKEKGFKIIDEDEEILSFRYQMNNIHMYNNKEEDFLFISLPKFADVTEENITQVKDYCNQINSEIKMIKLYVIRDIIIASAEIFTQSPKELYYQIDMALKLLISAKIMYNNLDE